MVRSIINIIYTQYPIYKIFQSYDLLMLLIFTNAC